MNIIHSVSFIKLKSDFERFKVAFLLGSKRNIIPYKKRLSVGTAFCFLCVTLFLISIYMYLCPYGIEDFARTK